ncbi:DUF4352 domain-containing protein [Gottfriedia acidiceleris]|uniref:DUF4352 domain-containing protein n=1 Tax=Gottfriedia acidiceleris TaxID=371036 RepID=UPI00101D5BB9|nr:DUF4352 domain-containing protein [Gottfriedia acidiceleris]
MKDKLYKIGETIEFDKIQITIDQAHITKPSNKSKYTGNVLTVDLQLWSKPYSKDVHVNASDFELYDSKGEMKQHYKGYIGQEISGNLSGEKKPDHTVRGIEGSLYFEIPKEDKYILVYKPTFSKNVSELEFDVNSK